MSTALTDAESLRARVAGAAADAFFFDCAASVRVADLVRGTSLDAAPTKARGRSVLIATASQLTAALALIELDGIARRLLILPPDVDPDHLGALIAGAGIDAVVTDGTVPPQLAGLPVRLVCTPRIVPVAELQRACERTEWVLLTSGTTGVPKMVAHGVAGLTAAIAPGASAEPVVWGTFYDIRRYGGLQIFLRAVLGGASLVLSNAGEPVAEHLSRLARHGVTHLSGTPSHWRRALMSPEIGKIAPRYVRLSGEIADQPILDNLRAAFPHADIGHAYASTEAGVAFAVDDGCAGFPTSFLSGARNGVEIKVVDGSLRIRSPGTALHYVGGASNAALHDSDGFVDSGDMVERQGDRYVFVGREGGIINIGGLKVHPEEVEAVINRHPRVRMSLVRPKHSPFIGAIVVADIVLTAPSVAADNQAELREDILKHCRRALPRHKVPAAISFVPALPVAATGKLARRGV
jgi:acyl-coenzyme A synthetase/AMP-(fatty) acid ligase